MNNTIDVVAILKPLFGASKVPMKPATETSLNLFKERAAKLRGCQKT